MAAGKINLQKASGGITAITGVDGTGNTQLVLPESGTVATTAEATETTTGLIELATTAETQTGTDDARAITPLKLKNSVIGLGQTLQNVIGSRAYNQVYTNSTGKAITVYLHITTLAGTGATLQIETSVGSGVYELVAGDAGSVNITTNLVGIVPNGCRYKVVTVNTPTLYIWKELR